MNIQALLSKAAAELGECSGAKSDLKHGVAFCFGFFFPQRYRVGSGGPILLVPRDSMTAKTQAA